MDLRLLSHFVVVAEHLHFRRASEVLGTAQPTLSQQIATLEEHLGVRLFDRSQRTVRLTHAGQVYLNEAKKVLTLVAAAADRAHEAEHGKHGTLLVGAFHTPVFAYLPKVVLRFRKLFPEVYVHLSVHSPPDLMESLRTRSVEIAFGRIKVTEIDPEFAVEVLQEHPLRLILPIDHPAAQDDVVDLRVLNGERLITYPRATIGSTFDQVITLCRQHGFVPGSIREVQSIEPLMGLVACGDGVAILPSTWTAVMQPGVVERPIKAGEDSTFTTAAFWHKKDTSPLLSSFVETARTVCNPMFLDIDAVKAL